MKRTILTTSALLLTIASLWAQSYNTAVGMRLGTDWGLTARQRVYENISAELLIQSSLQREETMLTLLALQHNPLLSRRLNFFFGGGFHVGWLTPEADALDPGDPAGIDLLAGIEVTLGGLNLSYDFKPAINLGGGEKTFYSQTGISMRYVFWKRERYSWEKSPERRDRERRRKQRRRERSK